MDDIDFEWNGWTEPNGAINGLGLAKKPTSTPRRSERYPFGQLITADSAKIVKTNKAQLQWVTAVMYFAPGDISGYEVCPNKTMGCFGERGENCIYNTGRHVGEGSIAMTIKNAFINRTKFYFEEQRDFMDRLYYELNAWRTWASRQTHGGKKKRLAIRLNGQSDLVWERKHPEIFRDFPDVQFFDYTKSEARFKGIRQPDNYHLTFSRSEDNDDFVAHILETRPDVNVAVVWDTRPKIGRAPAKTLPPYAGGRPIVDGDLHDLRFLESARHDPSWAAKYPNGALIGLRAKGGLRKLVKTGEARFVVYEDQIIPVSDESAKYAGQE